MVILMAVLVHDSGNDFNGSNILARYSTPDYDYGDLGTLKTLHMLEYLLEQKEL